MGAERYQRLAEERKIEADPTVRWCQNPACGRHMRGFTEADPALFALPKRRAAANVALVWAGAVLAGHRWA